MQCTLAKLVTLLFTKTQLLNTSLSWIILVSLKIGDKVVAKCKINGNIFNDNSFIGLIK